MSELNVCFAILVKDTRLICKEHDLRDFYGAADAADTLRSVVLASCMHLINSASAAAVQIYILGAAIPSGGRHSTFTILPTYIRTNCKISSHRLLLLTCFPLNTRKLVCPSNAVRFLTPEAGKKIRV